MLIELSVRRHILAQGHVGSAWEAGGAIRYQLTSASAVAWLDRHHLWYRQGRKEGMLMPQLQIPLPRSSAPVQAKASPSGTQFKSAGRTTEIHIKTWPSPDSTCLLSRAQMRRCEGQGLGSQAAAYPKIFVACRSIGHHPQFNPGLSFRSGAIGRGYRRPSGFPRGDASRRRSIADRECGRLLSKRTLVRSP
jgi:hypothetical protein